MAERKFRHGAHCGRTAHRLFMAICQFPAMRVSWLREMVGGSAGEVSRHLGRFVETGLVAVFGGRHYLSELGMKRAANMSRVLPAVIRSRHGAYLDCWCREHEQHHDDGVNRLVVRFAREGVEVVAGWRGEVNVPSLTQVRPDLLVQVSEGPLGAGTHYIEFERAAVLPGRVAEKLGPYHCMAGTGRPLPLLVVCETDRGEENFRAAGRRLPMLTATQERALAGPLTGPVTVWRRNGHSEALRCRYRQKGRFATSSFAIMAPGRKRCHRLSPVVALPFSTMLRSSSPTSRVRAKPRVGGVWTNRTRVPTAEASRRSNFSKEKVSGPAALPTEFFLREPAATAWAARSSA